MKNSTKEKTMLDPDVTLGDMHSLALRLLAYGDADDEMESMCADGDELADLVIKLDGFLAAGGMMPRIRARAKGLSAQVPA